MYLSIFFIALSMSVFTYLFLVRKLKPVTRKKTQFVTESRKAGRSLNEFTWREMRDQLLGMIKTVNVSEEFREEMNRDLYRLGWEYRAEDIRKMQILYSLIFIACAILMFFVSFLIGMIMLGLTPVVWNTPVTYVKKAIKERNDEFILRLDELYAVIFNQYKRKNDERLDVIVMAYVPTASALMQKELALFVRDMDMGEEHALKQLKTRIPHPVVLRFCDLIMTNLEGVDNVDVMENFYMELKLVRDRRRRKRNEVRARNLDIVNNSLYVPFTFLVIIYLIVSNMSSF